MSAAAAFVDGRFAAFIGVMAILIVIPGPDTAMVIRSALRSGAAGACQCAVGVGAGSLVWACASALGVGVVLESSAIAFTVVKSAGAAYLVVLGLRSFFSHEGSVEDKGVRVEPGSGAPFRHGLVNNLLNPKAAAIFITVLPQFLHPDDSITRLALMVLCYEVMVVGWLCLYGWVLARVARSRAGLRARRQLERVTGVVMVALGLRLAVERR